MTGRDLRAARIRLVGDHRHAVKIMAEKLETPKRTYQGWEARKGVIPGAASVAVKCLLLLAELDGVWQEKTAPQEEAVEVQAPAA